MIIFNEIHLRRILRNYVAYYNKSRTHLSLNKQTPINTDDAEQKCGNIVAFPRAGGLHHHYERLAAYRFYITDPASNVRMEF